MPNDTKNNSARSIALTRLERDLESLECTPEDRAVIENFKQELIGLDASSPRALLLINIFSNNLLIDSWGLEKNYLMNAAEEGDCGIIKLVRALGGSLNVEFSNGDSALTLAIKANKQESVNLLEQLMEEARGLSSNELVLTALLRKPTLTQEEESSILKLLSEGVNPNLLAGSGVPALAYALQKGNLQAAKILVAAENTNKKCLSLKHPPLNQSIYESIWLNLGNPISESHKNIIQFLCMHHVDPNVDIINGLSLMNLARLKRKTQFINMVHQFTSEAKEVKSQNNSNDDQQKELEIGTVIKDMGHVLGVATEIAGIKSTGYTDFNSYSLLKKCLTSTSFSPDSYPVWLKKDYMAENSPIKQALDLASEWLKMDGVTTHQDLLNLYNTGKPIFLPSGWIGHSITLIAWNDILIISNRGEKALEHCVSVFKIPSPGRLTKESLQNIIPETYEPVAEEVLNGIRKIVNLDDPMLTFNTKPQKIGHCSFANLKASLLPVLFFIELIRHSSSSNDISALNSEFFASFINNQAVLFNQLKNEAFLKYKQLTNYFRDLKSDELSNHFNLLASDSLERKIYKKMIKGFVSAHHGQPLLYYSATDNIKRITKMNLEKQRVEKMLHTTALLPSEKSSILSKILLKQIKGIEVSLYMNEGKNFRSCAVKLAIENLKWLIGQGADINFRDKKKGTTPLIEYAQSPHKKNISMVQLLIDLGADLDATHKNWNALKWAEVMGYGDKNNPIVRLLQSATNAIYLSSLKRAIKEKNEAVLNQLLTENNINFIPDTEIIGFLKDPLLFPSIYPLFIKKFGLNNLVQDALKQQAWAVIANLITKAPLKDLDPLLNLATYSKEIIHGYLDNLEAHHDKMDVRPQLFQLLDDGCTHGLAQLGRPFLEEIQRRLEKIELLMLSNQLDLNNQIYRYALSNQSVNQALQEREKKSEVTRLTKSKVLGIQAVDDYLQHRDEHLSFFSYYFDYYQGKIRADHFKNLIQSAQSEKELYLIEYALLTNLHGTQLKKDMIVQLKCKDLEEAKTKIKAKLDKLVSANELALMSQVIESINKKMNAKNNTSTEILFQKELSCLRNKNAYPGFFQVSKEKTKQGFWHGIARWFGCAYEEDPVKEKFTAN